MNQQEKKIAKVVEIAATEDLSEYGDILKKMKKDLGIFFGGNRRIAAALIKEFIGDVSKIDLEKSDLKPKGKLVFEDVKDGKVRLFANVGKAHRLTPGDLIREIVKRSGVDGKLIGKIDIHQTYSFLEVPEAYAEVILLSFDNAKYRGAKMVLEPAKPKNKDK